MRGRPPKPTALKVLEGNRGKRNLKDRREPEPARADASPPAELQGRAREIWEDLAPELVRCDLLRIIDRRRLATACQLQAFGDLYAAGIRVVPKKKHGRLRTLKPSPALWAAVKCWEKAGQIFDRFGITPVARARLSVSTGQEGKTKWAGLLE